MTGKEQSMHRRKRKREEEKPRQMDDWDAIGQPERFRTKPGRRHPVTKDHHTTSAEPQSIETPTSEIRLGSGRSSERKVKTGEG